VPGIPVRRLIRRTAGAHGSGGGGPTTARGGGERG
jgi:hypothetical protein